MKRVLTKFLVAGAMVLAFATHALAADVKSLRSNSLQDDSVVAEPYQVIQTKKHERSFRQQPPLIPHETEKYEIDLKVNQCLRCHDWRFAAKEKAPEVPKTHYKDRNGEETEEVTRGRWFCNQCHVPQMAAPSLVENTFQASGGGR